MKVNLIFAFILVIANSGCKSRKIESSIKDTALPVGHLRGVERISSMIQSTFMIQYWSMESFVPGSRSSSDVKEVKQLMGDLKKRDRTHEVSSEAEPNAINSFLWVKTLEKFSRELFANVQFSPKTTTSEESFQTKLYSEMRPEFQILVKEYYLMKVKKNYNPKLAQNIYDQITFAAPPPKEDRQLWLTQLEEYEKSHPNDKEPLLGLQIFVAVALLNPHYLLNQ